MMEGPGSNHSLTLHRLLPENSLASTSSTFFEDTCGSSVHGSSISSGIQQHITSVDDPIPAWWEVEAEEILRGTDLPAIRLLCRYRTYRDSRIPASILRTSWTTTCDTYLRRLTADTYSPRDIEHLDLDQKVQVLLRWLEPICPTDRSWWHTPLPSLLQSTSQIISELKEQSWSLFRDITFSDFVREALYPKEIVNPIETFIDWHDTLFYELLGHLERFPAEEEKFTQIQQRLPKESPVYWAVTQSILSARSRSVNMGFPDPSSLKLIYGPLRTLARNQRGNLVGMLKHLAVLEERFQRRYLREEEEMNWTCDFDTSTDFFDRVITMSPRDLAIFITKDDLNAFGPLDLQSIINGDSNLQRLHRQWNRRCHETRESIVAERFLGACLVHVAQELRKRRNFYSLCAILQALRETGFDESKSPQLFVLIDPSENYAVYRDIYRRKGLPFLVPHIQHLKQCQQQAVSKMVPVGGYEKPMDSTQAQAFEQQEPLLDVKQLSRGRLAFFPVKRCIPCIAARHDKHQIRGAPRHTCA